MSPKQILLVLVAVLTSVVGGYTASDLTEPVIMAPECPVCEVCPVVAPVVEPVPGAVPEVAPVEIVPVAG